jgi:hypothetical protein
MRSLGKDLRKGKEREGRERKGRGSGIPQIQPMTALPA